MLLQSGVAAFRRKYSVQSLSREQQIALANEGYYASQEGQNIVIGADMNGIPPEIVRQNRLALQEITERARLVTLTQGMKEKLEKNAAIDSLVRLITPKGQGNTKLFPQNKNYPWNYSNMGPIYIPKKGKTVKLDTKVLPFYKKIIREYEENTLSVLGNEISINGQVVDSYTFKQDYYWMMGDNRDHSEDSRAWGYVPENHIVGTPIFIWMSFDNFTDIKGRVNKIWKWKPRWDRIFTTVNGTGEPVSYFKWFLIALAGYFAFDYFWKRKKSKQ